MAKNLWVLAGTAAVATAKADDAKTPSKYLLGRMYQISPYEENTGNSSMICRHEAKAMKWFYRAADEVRSRHGLPTQSKLFN